MERVKNMAERQGFEPWVPEGTTVFETAAFDHSATSPITAYIPYLRSPSDANNLIAEI